MTLFKQVQIPQPDPTNLREKDLYFALSELILNLDSIFNKQSTFTFPNFISNVATGTQPFACASTILNTNLNADLLDGNHAAAFELALTKYNLAGTTNQVVLSDSGTGILLGRNITLSTPQDIATTSSPIFANLNIINSVTAAILNIEYASLHSDDSTNLFLGYQVGIVNTPIAVPNEYGMYNMGIGSLSLHANTIGSWNMGIGRDTLANNVNGIMNTAIGGDSQQFNIDGNGNTSIGVDALRLNQHGSNNVAIGGDSGYNNIGSGSIFIGTYSGANETGSKKLIIDSQKWDTEADSRAHAIISGVMDATVANQILTLNVGDLYLGAANLHTTGNLGAGRITGDSFVGFDQIDIPTSEPNGFLSVVDDILWYFAGGHRYRLTATLDDSEALSPITGNPIGLFLSLTYTV
jgi:hypothetical protein